MSGLQICDDLRSIERKYNLTLLVEHNDQSRQVTEYAQFENRFRVEAARMGELYEVFFCLENSIRSLISDVLTEFEGPDWWNSSRVDESRIRKPCDDRRQKEVDSAITPRSDKLIDYTTFGELSQLITDNWDLFDTIFRSKKAVSNITNQLNLLRGPIAHCNPTDDLEQERLNLAVKSWFKIIS